MSKLIRNLAVASTAGLLMAGNAFGGITPQTTTFQVSTQVIKSCIIGASNLVFPNYDQLSAVATTGSTTVTVRCTNGTVATIALNIGQNGTTFAAPRVMKDSVSGGLLNYNLYTTSGYTTVWGDGTNSSATQSYTSASSATVQPFTVYGSIPAGQTVATSAAATYADTITMSVTF
jgi:spore coat protein U-like protein